MIDKEKELQLFYRQAMAVNEKLRRLGEEIPLSEELFKAFLAGVLDRLLAEGKLSVSEATEIENLMEGVYDPFSIQLAEMGLIENGRNPFSFRGPIPTKEE